MNQISIEHPIDGASKTYLTAECAASATTCTVENSTGFATDDLVRFGELGEERAEIVTLTSVPSTTSLGHTTGPSFLQRTDVPVYEMNYNQIEIYSSTSSGGNYALLATISINVGSNFTVYQDSTGDNDTWYKTRFKNSVATTYSGYSAASQATGYTTNSFRYMQDMVAEELGDPLFEQYNRSLIKKYLNAAQMVIAQGVVQLHGHHLMSYTTQALTTGTSTYTLPTNFIAFRKVTISFAGEAAHTARFKREDATQTGDSFNTEDPLLFLRGSSFYLEPTTRVATGGTVYMWYHKGPTAMTDDDDEDGLPYGATNVLVPYACYRALQHKGEIDRAAPYKEEYREARTEYLQMLSESGQDTNPKEVIIFDSELYDIADYEAY